MLWRKEKFENCGFVSRCHIQTVPCGLSRRAFLFRFSCRSNRKNANERSEFKCEIRLYWLYMAIINWYHYQLSSPGDLMIRWKTDLILEPRLRSVISPVNVNLPVCMSEDWRKWWCVWRLEPTVDVTRSHVWMAVILSHTHTQSQRAIQL